MSGLSFPTPDAVAVITRLRSERHPWILQAEQWADSPIPDWASGDGFFDYLPWWGTVLYAGGDSSRGRAACERLLQLPTTPPANINLTRESLLHLATMHVILDPIFLPEERAASETRMRNWCEFARDRTRIGDGDQTIGHYFGCKLVDRVLGTDYADQLNAMTLTNYGISTEDDIRRVVGLCTPGGVWRESSEYNLGTIQLLLWGAHQDGIENWPEVAAIAPELLRSLIHEMTPDWWDSAQWGDVEKPHYLDPVHRLPCLAALIQLGYDTDGQGRALLNQFLNQFTQWEYMIYVWRVLLLGFDPAVAAPALVQPTGLRYSPFVGIALDREADRLLILDGAHDTQEDHGAGNAFDWRLWESGYWSQDRPLGYIAPADARNTVLFSGLPKMLSRGFTEVTQTPTGVHAVWTTGGYYYPENHWQRPDPFVQSFTRTIDRDGSIIRIKDEGAGVATPDLTQNYIEPERSIIQNSLATFASIFNCDSQPVQDAEGNWLWNDKAGRGRKLAVTGHENVVVRQTSLVNVGASEQADRWQLCILTSQPNFVINYTESPADVPVPVPVPPPPPPSPAEWIESGRYETVTEMSPTFRKRHTETWETKQ